MDGGRDYRLYRMNTPYENANTPLCQTTGLDPHCPSFSFDANSQTFKQFTILGPQPLAQTSIVRLYPGSSDTSIVQDDAVLALNKSVYGLFASAGLTVKDVRSHYRLVGAVWLDDPDHDFKVNSLVF